MPFRSFEVMQVVPNAVQKCLQGFCPEAGGNFMHVRGLFRALDRGSR